MPDQPGLTQTVPPMVYVIERTVWEYKQITRALSQGMPAEAELNRFGKEGWELVSILNDSARFYLYFKRMKD